MLKWILFLLSEYYFEIFRENSAEILANIKKKVFANWFKICYNILVDWVLNLTFEIKEESGVG